MKRIILPTMMICLFFVQAQDKSSMEKFFVTFPAFDKTEKVLYFGDLLAKKKYPITKNDAVSYIYGGDISRILCRGVFMNMETEEVSGHYVDTVLPYKIGKIKMGKTNFVFYTTTECKSERDVWWTNIEMSVFIEGTGLSDKHRIYRENEYDYSIISLINADRAMLFRRLVNTRGKIEYQLLKLSENKPYLSIVKSAEKDINADNLFKALKVLGWSADMGL
ncbi:MAG: hypothetical protein LBG17_08365 [Bacteroidales bacterium]|nr:hypothetical protein [Bacteroidales bacterium]